MKTFRVIFVGAAALALAACVARTQSDDDDGSSSQTTASSGTGAQDPATVADACAGHAALWLACYDDPGFDQARCNAAEACFRLVMRDPAEQALLDCYAAWSRAPECGEWSCDEKVAQVVDATPEHTAHQQRCADWAAACGGSAGDICRNSVLQIEGALLAQLAGCFDLGCGQAVLEDCIAERAASYLASCGGDMGGLW